MSTTANGPKNNKQTSQAKTRATARKLASKAAIQKKSKASVRRLRVTGKSKSEERFVLEQLEGEDFDTTDFKLVTDFSDA